MAEKLRLFVAVAVPEDVRTSVDHACVPLRASAPDLRWTEPANWHLTLAFLGWVEPDLVQAVESAVAGAAAGSRSFELALDGHAGSFGGRVLWAGLRSSPELSDLAADVQDRLRAIGFAIDDRSFHPHLTLARAPRGRRARRDLTDDWSCDPRSWTVSRLDLMRSRLSPRGARYTVHRSWPLDAAGT